MSDNKTPVPLMVKEDQPLITLEDAREIVMLLESGMQQEADSTIRTDSKRG